MLAALLFGSYRRRVLGLLLLHPEKTYHVREIARLTKTAPGTLHRELARLADAGLLSREQVGNQLRYAANTECPVFEELASILRKTSGLADSVLDALVGLTQQIDVALIFGSVARGEERAGSDVDVLIIGSLGFADAVKALHPVQEKIGREINPVVMSPMEFERKQHDGDGFVRELLAKEKFFLIGDEDELGKLASHPPPGQA
jgi:predicted nucleotidyltransferase